MNKIKLYKAAIDFAFENVDEKNAVSLAEKSIAAFKKGKFSHEDLSFWDQSVRAANQQFSHLKNQMLPSEQAVKQAELNKPMEPIAAK